MYESVKSRARVYVRLSRPLAPSLLSTSLDRPLPAFSGADSSLLLPWLQAVHVIGYCGCVTTTVMFGSPLATLGRVVRTKSTESMVFSLCLMNFIVSVTWALYGYVIGDLFVQVRCHMPVCVSVCLCACVCLWLSVCVCVPAKLC